MIHFHNGHMDRVGNVMMHSAAGSPIALEDDAAVELLSHLRLYAGEDFGQLSAKELAFLCQRLLLQPAPEPMSRNIWAGISALLELAQRNLEGVVWWG